MPSLFPDERETSSLTPSGKCVVPAVFPIFGKDKLFVRPLLILPQVIVEFQMQQVVALLAIISDESTETCYAFSKALVIESEKMFSGSSATRSISTSGLTAPACASSFATRLG